MNKKAQTMGIPFQLIFSLIIVVVVVVFGFMAIKMFLGRADQTKYGTTFIEIRDEIDNAYGRAGGKSKNITVNALKGVEAICFVNKTTTCSDSRAGTTDFCELVPEYMGNMFYYPIGIAEEHDGQSDYLLNCQNKTCFSVPTNKNPQCFWANQEKKIEIRIVKEIGDPFVRLE
jgi:hypothetical protein